MLALWRTHQNALSFQIREIEIVLVNLIYDSYQSLLPRLHHPSHHSKQYPLAKVLLHLMRILKASPKMIINTSYLL